MDRLNISACLGIFGVLAACSSSPAETVATPLEDAGGAGFEDAGGGDVGPKDAGGDVGRKDASADARPAPPACYAPGVNGAPKCAAPTWLAVFPCADGVATLASVSGDLLSLATKGDYGGSDQVSLGGQRVGPLRIERDAVAGDFSVTVTFGGFTAPSPASPSLGARASLSLYARNAAGRFAQAAILQGTGGPGLWTADEGSGGGTAGLTTGTLTISREGTVVTMEARAGGSAKKTTTLVGDVRIGLALTGPPGIAAGETKVAVGDIAGTGAFASEHWTCDSL